MTRWRRTIGRCTAASLLGLVALTAGGTAFRPSLRPTPASASVVLALSLEELTRRADLIVVAVPTEEQSRRHIDGKLIVTDFSLKVETVLKDDAKPGAAVVATVLGGSIDDLALQVPGEATFAIGQRVIAFLQRAEASGDLRVVGMSQGVMPLLQQDAKTMVLPSGDDAALMGRDAQGHLTEMPAAITKPIPIGELLGKIRSIVAAQKK